MNPSWAMDSMISPAALRLVNSSNGTVCLQTAVLPYIGADLNCDCTAVGTAVVDSDLIAAQPDRNRPTTIDMTVILILFSNRTSRLNLAGGAQRNRRSVPGGCSLLRLSVCRIVADGAQSQKIPFIVFAALGVMLNMMDFQMSRI